MTTTQLLDVARLLVIAAVGASLLWIGSRFLK
jgi:hypothetical protein